VGTEDAGAAVEAGGPAEPPAGVAVATHAQTAPAEVTTSRAEATPQPLMTQSWAEACSAELLAHWQL